MNNYKEIMVQIKADDRAKPTLESALKVAKKFIAHLDVFHVKPQPNCLVPVPVVSSDIASFVVNEVVTAEEKASGERADEARLIFDNFVEKNVLKPLSRPQEGIDQVTVEYREIDGVETDVTAWNTHIADLMIMGRPAEGVAAEEDMEIINAAVMEGGAAILLTPKLVPETIGNRVAILWDASGEAAKAVTYAMPFLKTAEEVVILETENNSEDADSAALAKRLAWHGIQTQIIKMPEISSVSERAQEVIKQTCGHFDMIVMGAYTHSSMRRWILGDFTKTLVLNADISLLMSH